MNRSEEDCLSSGLKILAHIIAKDIFSGWSDKINIINKKTGTKKANYKNSVIKIKEPAKS